MAATIIASIARITITIVLFLPPGIGAGIGSGVGVGCGSSTVASPHAVTVPEAASLATARFRGAAWWWEALGGPRGLVVLRARARWLPALAGPDPLSVES